MSADLTKIDHVEYIGDGVHASFDGYNIWLKTEREDGIWNSVALEPETFTRLLDYRARLIESFNAKAGKPA